MFRRGREEDAHECLRFILERMQDACLGKKSNSTTKKKIGIEQEMETFIYRTFGFKTVSCVHCTSCGHNSLTFDPALDISLDVKGVGSISDSFRKFYKADVLSGDNKYRCSGCNKRVVAKKFSRLCTAPRVLTIHLKRFSFSAFGPTKYQKHVDFSPRFSLEVNGLNYVYDLYGVLVHTGIAQAGHYYSFMKSPSGAWYLFDDELVRSVNISTVLKQNAYILFYALAPTSIPTPTPLSTIPAVSLPEGEIDIYSAQSPAPQAKEKNNSKEVVDLCSDEEKMLVEEKNTKVTHTKQGPEESKKVVITAENSLKKKIVVSKYKKLIFKEEVLNALKKGSITTTSISTTTEGEEHQGKLQLPKKKKAKTTSYNEEKLNDDNNNNNQDESPAKTMVVEQPRKSAWKLKSEERELKKIATVKELHSGNRSQFGEKVGKWDAEEGNGGDAVDTREKELSRLEPKIRGPSKWDEDYDAPKAPKKKKKGEDVLGKDHSKTFDELQRTREANRKDPGRFSKMAPGKRQAKLNKREKQDMKQKQKQKQQLFHNNKFSNKNVHGHQKHNNNKNSHYNNNKRK